MSLERYFQPFRDGIVGSDLTAEINSQQLPIVYADWTASGRLYQPIEDFMSRVIGPYVANTHTETTMTGTTMTHAYHEAQTVIKKHVNADDNDVLIAAGAGMTAVINKFQRILGLRIPDKWLERIEIPEEEKPVVFITHMEHHSNQTTWNTCEVTVQMIRPDANGLPDLEHLESLLEEFSERTLKIGAFTACSNVTGIKTPYHQMAEIMHRHGGLCFVDFAASAPYVDINMHPANPAQKLDAIYFSPHKFLGGPGSSGILIFDKKLYQNKVPDQPGGGTVSWTNPWGDQSFFEDIEIREDGGTPGFLQLIRASLAVKVKEAMGVKNIESREKELRDILQVELAKNPKVNILENKQQDRLCIVSFYVLGLHHNLIVRLLNDRFGIQTRGGCSCAGTYGHILLDVDQNTSNEITEKIDAGDLTDKPGWVRVSLHPTSTDADARKIVAAINDIIENAEEWSQDYSFKTCSGEFELRHDNTRYLSLGDFDPLSPSKAPSSSSGLFNWLHRSA
ncbi:aminotransferase class V-fold PLP-dependent enzyme [Pleionea sp. CnH1-48]|uniref:aminotransferase class V-fold PLP-dependent enzyme n=1 Tax=Pleionea sp. CnH1-48 TaxID=2954494 RepID=UPI0020983750|nr:aminotransferase class V-fold PLP-dependent enzyme [Pleionea sp. CnH1-48]MCO7225227.1 aminotransferase class V-fold PLP-dependent enzyme [Pleionea sp. CnH1-48]